MERKMLSLRNLFLALVFLASSSLLVACDNAEQKDAEAPAAEAVAETSAEAGADIADSATSDANAEAEQPASE